MQPQSELFHMKTSIVVTLEKFPKYWYIFIHKKLRGRARQQNLHNTHFVSPQNEHRLKHDLKVTAYLKHI